MFENKIILNPHEQLALAMQNQSRDSFLSDTKKNPKDCMLATLKSGRELKSRNEAEKNNEVETKEEDHNAMDLEKKQGRTGLTNENEHMKD